MITGNEYIAKNLEIIKQKISAAALRSGRDPRDISIVAVTKTVGVDKIQTVVDEGILDLGENRVQELCEKYDNINGNCRWHLIGHLQTNKVKYIIDKVSMIHSVDSLELAREIQKRSEKAGKIMDVLLQINISNEVSKFGVSSEDAMEFVRNVGLLRNIKVKGLMTIAPYAENPEEIRYVFRELKKIFVDIRKENIDNIDMRYLSMGMSNDFEIAVEEGSNMVRIGTSIFGRRNY